MNKFDRMAIDTIGVNYKYKILMNFTYLIKILNKNKSLLELLNETRWEYSKLMGYVRLGVVHNLFHCYNYNSEGIWLSFNKRFKFDDLSKVLSLSDLKFLSEFENNRW